MQKAEEKLEVYADYKDRVNDLEESRKEQLSKFCPVILNTCRKDCTCYNEGTIKSMRFSNGTEKLSCYGAHCTHVLISGHIYTETN